MKTIDIIYPLVNQGKTQIQISKETGIKYETVRSCIKKYKLKPEKEKQIFGGRPEGSFDKKPRIRRSNKWIKIDRNKFDLENNNIIGGNNQTHNIQLSSEDLRERIKKRIKYEQDTEFNIEPILRRIGAGTN
jgi:hypothetical protein